MEITVTDSTGTIVEDATVPGDRASGAIAARLAEMLELPGAGTGAGATRYVFRHERTGRIVPDGLALVSAGVVDGDTLRLVALGGAPSPAAAAPTPLDEPTLVNPPAAAQAQAGPATADDGQRTVVSPRPAAHQRAGGAPGAAGPRPGDPPGADGTGGTGDGRRWAIVAGVVALLLAAGGVGYLVAAGGDDEPAPQAGVTTDARPPADTTGGADAPDDGSGRDAPDGGDAPDGRDGGDTTSVPTVRGDTPDGGGDGGDGRGDEIPADGGPPDDGATAQLVSAMELSAEGRRLSVAGDLSGAKINRIEVLSAIDAIETANGVDQIKAVDEFRKAIRASIAAIEEREAGLAQTAYDAQATAAKRRYCRLWESSGMAESSGVSCDPDEI
ncbi:MAG: EsaB/YukD family protein [Solirubrobacteraceae bacterium]|nr:EsaB/YukD family protein [Solirubrobacteraceae bacterium]